MAVKLVAVFGSAVAIAIGTTACGSGSRARQPAVAPAAVVTEPAPLSSPASATQPGGDGELEVQAACPADADSGTRCGDNDSHYCFEGRCLTQKACVAACGKHWGEVNRMCIEQARDALCEGDECAQGYAAAATRCALDAMYGEASCAEISCGDPSLSRRVRGEAQ